MNLKTIIVSGIILLVVDAIYLSIIGKDYGNMIKRIQGKDMKINIIGAVLCYVVMTLGLNYFILSEKKKNVKDLCFKAFILGLLVYGVYETTSYALLEKWDIKYVLIDTVWGGTLFALTTFFVLKLNL
jgi:uncharacterized membrane protein